jgi:hypothetical protein
MRSRHSPPIYSSARVHRYRPLSWALYLVCIALYPVAAYQMAFVTCDLHQFMRGYYLERFNFLLDLQFCAPNSHDLKFYLDRL